MNATQKILAAGTAGIVGLLGRMNVAGAQEATTPSTADAPAVTAPADNPDPNCPRDGRGPGGSGGGPASGIAPSDSGSGASDV